MTPDPDLRNHLIWATRGRTWGFRFLLTGGRADPLLDYERAFELIESGPEAWQGTAGVVALRFPDPLDRKDTAGRVIPHDFVLLTVCAERVASFEDGQQLVWPLVEGAYARIWDAESPPSAADLRFTTPG